MEIKIKGGDKKIRESERERKETLRKIKLEQFKYRHMFFIRCDSVIENK